MISAGAALAGRFPQARVRSPGHIASGAVATGFAGLLSRADRTGQLESMGATGTLFQIVSTFANSTSRAPWWMVETASISDDPRRPPARVGDHPALRLWRKPNPFFTGQQLVETVQQHIELVGEGFLLVERGTSLDMPLSMWPIRPDRMEPVPDPELFLLGWLYRGPAGEMVSLGRDEVIQIRQPHPADPYRGFGAIQSIQAELDTARYSAEWNRKFFVNGARPSGVVELAADSRAKAEEVEEFKENWRSQFMGVRNAHRVAVLEKGARWHETQFTARDMQFVEMGKATRDSIREAFGIAKTLLGQTEEVNRATAEAATMVFAQTKLQPRLVRWKQALNHELLPMYGESAALTGVEFDFDAEIPKDKSAEATLIKARAEAAERLVRAGWNPDDALAVVGLPPMTWKGAAA